MKSIVLIDDDLMRAQNLLEALRLFFSETEVKEFTHFEEAMSYLETHDCIVLLDIMFVPNGRYTGGIDAGVDMYKGIKSINRKHHIIVYTNRARNEMEDFVLQVNKDNNKFLRKLDTSIPDLISVVREFSNE